MRYALNYQPQEDNKGDFEFVINDQFVYTALQDFTSTDAREAFIKYQLLEKDFQAQSEKLEQLRTAFEETKSEQLAPAILDLEQRVQTMSDEIHHQEKKIRALELKK